MPDYTRDLARQIWAVIALVLASALVIGLVATLALRSITFSDAATDEFSDTTILVSRLSISLERESASGRAFLLTGDAVQVDRALDARHAFDADFDRLRARPHAAEGSALLERVAAERRVYETALDRVIAGRRNAADPRQIVAAFEDDVSPSKAELDRTLGRLLTRTQAHLDEAKRASAFASARAMLLVAGFAGGALVIAVGLGWVLRRALRRLRSNQQQLRSTLGRLETANRDLEAFAGRVAHDLRGALGPIVLTADLLAKGREGDQAVRGRLDRSVRRATGLVDGLLAFSRAGAVPDASERAEVVEVVRDVLEELESKLGQADVSTEVTLEPGHVRCAPALLHMVLANVVGNAIKYMRDAPKRHMEIRGCRARTGYEVRVSDTGPGIPSDALPRIFEPFYRVPGARAAGTGIGLATVRRIVEAHDGRVTAESSLGAGATFTVWLPLAKGEPELLPLDVAPLAH